MKKYLAEMVGTMVLVLMGCGVAVSLGCDPINNIPAVVGTALAFGLSVVAMAAIRLLPSANRISLCMSQMASGEPYLDIELKDGTIVRLDWKDIFNECDKNDPFYIANAIIANTVNRIPCYDF